MAGVCHVVTGAASGIGAAVTGRLVAAGASVVAVDLNSEQLVAKYKGKPRVVCVAADLLTAEGFDLLVKEIKSHFAAVVGFVHCAGFDAVAPLGMIRSEAVQKLVGIHAVFPVQFLGWLAKKPNHQEGAACVLISSLSAHEGAKGHVAYAAAKGAVEGLLKPAAAELVTRGIRLNAVVLGVVETEMSAGWMNKLSPDQLTAMRAEYPLGFGHPDDVAGIVMFLLGSESRWITAQTLICDGGHSIA